MTDQQPVEPDAIVDRDGAAVPYRRAEDNAAPLASHTLMPMLARMATAGPVLTASALAIGALAAAKAVEMAGRMAWQLAGGPVVAARGRRPFPAGSRSPGPGWRSAGLPELRRYPREPRRGCNWLSQLFLTREARLRGSRYPRAVAGGVSSSMAPAPLRRLK